MATLVAFTALLKKSSERVSVLLGENVPKVVIDAGSGKCLGPGGHVAASPGLQNEVISSPMTGLGDTFGRTISVCHGLSGAPSNFDFASPDHGQFVLPCEFEVLDETLFSRGGDEAPDGGSVVGSDKGLEARFSIDHGFVHILMEDDLLSFDNFTGFGIRVFTDVFVKGLLHSLSCTACFLLRKESITRLPSFSRSCSG